MVDGDHFSRIIGHRQNQKIGGTKILKKKTKDLFLVGGKGAYFVTTSDKKKSCSHFIGEGGEDGHSEERSGIGHHQRGQHVGHMHRWRGWLEAAHGGSRDEEASGGVRMWQR